MPYLPSTFLSAIACLLCWTTASDVSAETAVPVKTNDPIVAKIDNLTVSAEEYRLIMYRQVAGVYSYFAATAGLEDSVDFWRKKEGSCPIDLLRSRTLEELRRIKALQAFAGEKGLPFAADFDHCRKAWQKENERRRRAAAGKQPIYGPKQYSFEIYYFICLDDLIYRLKEALAKEAGSRASEAAVLEYWETNREQLGGKSLEELRSRIVILLQERDAEKVLQQRVDAAHMEVNEAAIALILPRDE